MSLDLDYKCRKGIKYIIHRTRDCLRYFSEDFPFAPLSALQQYSIEAIFVFINLSVVGLPRLGCHLLEHWLKPAIDPFTFLPKTLGLLLRKSEVVNTKTLGI